MNDIKPVLWILFFLLLVVVCQYVYLYWPQQLGAPKYDVTGTVLVNGEPAGGLRVQFFSQNEEHMIQDRNPRAMTDSEGRFRLSSFGGNDGAAAGEYSVVFVWPANVLTGDKDRFQGKFADYQSSEFTVQIPPRHTVLPPFELVVPEKELLPPVFSLDDMIRAVELQSK